MSNASRCRPPHPALRCSPLLPGEGKRTRRGARGRCPDTAIRSAWTPSLPTVRVPDLLLPASMHAHDSRAAAGSRVRCVEPVPTAGSPSEAGRRGDRLMATTARALGPKYRAAALRRLADEHFDILVIGAGVVGAGAALDAASRGLKVALVEARDFASGTSSRSSKLVHGGLRYLKQLNFAAGVRGVAGAQADPRDALPAPGPAGRIHLPAGEARLGPRLRRRRRRRLRRARRRPWRTQPPQAPVEEGDAASLPLRQAGGDQGRHQVLRGPARRRPAHDDDRAHRGRLRRRRRVEYPGHSLPARRGDGGRRRRPRPRVRPGDPHPGQRRPSTPPACGPTRSSR